MKNEVKKTICICMATLIMCLSMVVSAFASDSLSTITTSPRYAHCNDCTTTFSITDPGTAHVTVTYYAYPATFHEAKISVQIQKRFLGLFWKTVDIGYANNEWVAYSTDIDGYFYNYFTVDGKGTYRANITLEIKGTDGTVDLIEDTIERKFS